MTTIIVASVSAVVGFVIGILVGRRNAALVNTAVTDVTKVVGKK
jgi:hypothetical protein